MTPPLRPLLRPDLRPVSPTLGPDPTPRRAIRRATVGAGVLALLATACTLPPAPARMALPAALADAPEVAFTGLGGGRRGGFDLDGAPVRFERSADTLSVAGALRADRGHVQVEHAGVSGRCDARGVAATPGVLDAPLAPLQLQCRFTGADAGTMMLRERPLAAGGTRRVREGDATFGAVTLEIRSEHALQGTSLPLPQPAGYRIRHQGRDVAALSLAAGTPSLRRAADLDGPTRRAVTQVALALALWRDPAVAGP